MPLCPPVCSVPGSCLGIECIGNMPAIVPCVLLTCEYVCVSPRRCVSDCESGLLSPGPRSWERLQPVIKSLFEAPLSLVRNFLNFSNLGFKRRKTQSPPPTPPQRGPLPSPGVASRWWGLSPELRRESERS